MIRNEYVRNGVGDLTFWDFCAPPFYNFAERTNKRAYDEMVETICEITPVGVSVLEIAAGTSSIRIAVSNKASKIHCTGLPDLQEILKFL